MKFNRISLHGFKSFVDKTVIDFPDGITAIVGPNGSGKSNIMDAVRWVFGEQNAKELRGTDMEDVVFNGSQKRKPAGFAEVSLTLSDIDENTATKYGTFSEISITRKYYKTGEREYYINNKKCRLKDIKDIFMDTGLGARSISIIEQGKVDKIINASPEELRFFLEETAGVTKFKDKKKEAEKRLQQTRDNLNRVNDIIQEIVVRIEGLASQVEILKKSEKLQNNKRVLEKRYLTSIYSSKEKDLLDKKNILTNKQNELIEKIAIYNKYLKKENISNLEYTRLEEENRKIQENRVLATKNLAITEGEINNLKEKISSIELTKTQLSEDIDKENKRLELLIKAKQEIESNIDTEKEGIDDIGFKISELEDIIDDLRSKKEEISEEYAISEALCLEYTAEITNKRNEAIKAESNMNYQENILQRLKKELKEITTSNKDVQKAKGDIIKEIDHITVLMMETEDTLLKLKDESIELTKESEEYRIKQSELTGILISIKSTIEFLEEQIKLSSISKEDENLFRDLKIEFLIEYIPNMDKRDLINIGDVLVFDDKDYDKVFNTIKNMKNSLRFTFQSEINNIIYILNNNPIESIDSNIFKYESIFKHIGDEDKGLQIVNLKERIEVESARINVIEEELNICSDKLYEVNQSRECKVNQVEAAEKNLKEIRSEFTKRTTELENIDKHIERNLKRNQIVTKEIELSEKSLKELYNKLEECNKVVEETTQKYQDVEEARYNFEERLAFVNNGLEDKKDDTHELKIEYSKNREKLSYYHKELQLNITQSQDIEKNIFNFKNRLEKLINKDEQSWSIDLRQQESKLLDYHKELLTLEEKLKKLELLSSELKQEIEKIRKEIEHHNSLIKEIENISKNIEINIASIESFIEGLESQYIEKFEVDIKSEYKDYKEENFQPNKIRSEINNIDIELNSLGAINLNAFNDYNEAEDRYNFLTGQRNDLESSISDINSFINETDQTTVKMFSTTYNAVKDKFIDVFKILFGNGEAELRLTDPENLLHTGVEIYIQPSGKKLQHMGLLSGGEKALTAMTLLFALFLQKPTPFCFLDEVDAPLDDANVERYTSMVKALSNNTQFILITHNHNTMSVADSLYGVTMQEYGVSSILSVKLEQMDKAGR